MALSTHFAQSGAACLERWGLLDAVAASGCPAIRDFMLDFGPIQLRGEPVPAGDQQAAYAPRRSILDRILLDAALRAGVELRTECRVTELSVGADGVTGIVGQANGAPVVETARVVIGADGRNSQVAQLVQADMYHEVPALEGTYFGYWRDLPLHGLELHLGVPGRGVYAFPTNDDLTLVGVNWAIADFRGAMADIEGSYRATITSCASGLATRMASASRNGKLIGGTIANFIRKPFGPGWALVGDAGLTMDPCTAAGINNAFRDAEFLCEALCAGLSGERPIAEALGSYHQRRDAASKPIYGFTCDLAAFAPPSAEMAALFGALAGNGAQISRFLGVLAQTVPVADFFAPASIGRIMQSASDSAHGDHAL
jgi:2-polyprenyl-6-methoxyphenol hydroxylase-like FAD-dependent oxidoreductase